MTRASNPPNYGRGIVKLSIEGLTIPLGQAMLKQIFPVEAEIRYEWEKPYDSTDEEEGSYGYFNITSIFTKDMMQLQDRRTYSHSKIWKNANLCNIISEKQIEAFEIHVEALLRSDSADDYIVTKKDKRAHKLWSYKIEGDEGYE